MRTHARYESASSLDEVLPSSSLDSPLSVGSGSRSVSSESAEPLPPQIHHGSGATVEELSNSHVNKATSGVDEGEESGKPPSPMDTNEATGAREQDGDDDALL